MEYPLISCIMPTYKRRSFVEQAIKLFKAQDYPNKELVTVEDGDECNWDLALGTNYHHLGQKKWSIGEKRNVACVFARGDIFCQWDDDDYYGPQRLSKQVEPILQGEADVTAMRMSLMLNAPSGELWECSEQVHRALFAHNVRSGTLMYRASYWRESLRYEDSSRGEDVQFLYSLLKRGALLQQIIDPASYICIRHGGNVSAEVDGLHLPGWRQVQLEQYLPAEDDRAFYEQFASVRVTI